VERWDWESLSRQCRRVAQQVLGRSAEAEDAAQEAILRALRRWRTCEDPRRPEPWVRAIAHREALRIGGRRRELPLEAADEPATNHDEDLALVRIAVRQLVARLPESDRALLHAVYWEDLAGAEASRRLGQAAVSSRVRLHRLRRALERPLEHAVGRVG
jgi:RNA polymerase sigma-70 factor, ECF subfamily